jgi:TPR repeat protein
LDAQIWLGNYYNGGLKHREVFDQHKALEWFEKSADQGHAPSVQKVKELNNKGLYLSQKLKGNVRNKCR